MLSVALTLLLATWATTALRYTLAIRNTDVGLTAYATPEREPDRLAA